jgi:hypothetical protein
LLIEACLQALFDTVANAPEVATSDVALDKRGPQAGLIRGDITFVDGALLHFRELVDLESNPSRLMYSYHYQRADTSLVFRYDDTPHHPEISTFPHHKHERTESNALAAEAPTLATVLDEIGRLRIDQK